MQTASLKKPPPKPSLFDAAFRVDEAMEQSKKWSTDRLEIKYADNLSDTEESLKTLNVIETLGKRTRAMKKVNHRKKY